MDDPVLNNLRAITTPRIFKMGLRYYEQGRVVVKSNDGQHLTAVVRGTKDHIVTVTKKSGREYVYCTCTNDPRNCCEHIVAVVLDSYYASIDGGEYSDPEYGQYDSPGRAAHSTAASGADPYDYYESIENATQDVPYGSAHGQAGRRARDERRSMMDVDSDSTPEAKCRYILDSLYRDARNKRGQITERDKVSFAAIEMIAKQYEDRGAPDHAIEMYQHMCEYIIKNIDSVNNLKHYYTEQIQYSMRRIVALLRKHKPEQDRKNAYTSYFFERFLQVEQKLFARIYLDTLYEILKEEQDIRHCKTLFMSQIEANPLVSERDLRRQRHEILEAAAALLEMLDDSSLHDFLIKYHLESEDLRAMYIWHLADTDPEKSYQVAESAMRESGNPGRFEQMLEFLLGMHGKKEQQEILLDAFVRTSNWTYYEAMKDSAGDWKNGCKVLLERLRSDGKLNMYIDVLLREKKLDAAAKFLLESSDLMLLDAYRDEFAAKFSKEYHEKYSELLPRIVESARNLRDFDDIKRHMQTMKLIPGHKRATASFVSELESRYPQLAEQMEPA